MKLPTHSNKRRGSNFHRALPLLITLLVVSGTIVAQDTGPTQEQAAELLDLPFSTYRRHLKAGLDQITDYLWGREIGTLEK